MTRLQKKCFLFSVGMHGLLGVIVLGSSAFRDKPATKDTPILMTMIPARILDEAGAGGGSPEPAAAPQPAAPATPAVQAPQPAPPVVRTLQPIAPLHAAELLARPKPREVEREPAPQPLMAKEAEAKPARKTHEIHPDYTPASSVTQKKNIKTSESAAAESSSRAEARRLNQIAESLDALASGVKSSGAKGTVVEMPGQGGGEAFAGYETVIYNVYYHAWITPDSVANRLAATDAKIVVARDGTILSAEIISKSGEPALDKSVGRVLRAVTKLPPFPASARDEQRSFLIRFNLEAKEASG